MLTFAVRHRVAPACGDPQPPGNTPIHGCVVRWRGPCDEPSRAGGGMGHRGREIRRPWWLVGGAGALLITLRLALGFDLWVPDAPALRDTALAQASEGSTSVGGSDFGRMNSSSQQAAVNAAPTATNTLKARVGPMEAPQDSYQRPPTALDSE